MNPDPLFRAAPKAIADPADSQADPTSLICANYEGKRNRWNLAPALLVGRRALYRNLQVTRYTIPVTALPSSFDGVRIAQIADTHFRRMGALANKTLELLAPEKPDRIAVTGDLFTMPAGPHTVTAFLKRLVEIAPTYVVLGNHEHKPWLSGTPVAEIYRETGAVVLMDEAVPWERGSGTIWIAGIDDRPRRQDGLRSAFAHIPVGAPTILLAHNPSPAAEYVTAGASLTLSGHTHGGQVRIPFLGPVRVHDHIEREFCSGMFGVESLGPGPRDSCPALFISRGIGTLAVPIRLFCPPEIPILTLIRK